MTTRSSRFRSPRYPGAAAALLAALCAASCSSGPAAPPPQQLTLWSGIAPEFTLDLIRRFNNALPQIRVKWQATPGGVRVVSAIDQGHAQLGLTQSDIAYLAYRRGIGDNLYPHKNLRAVSVLWVNTLYVFVRRDSPYRSISDLKGHRVGIVLPGSSGEFSTRIVLGAYGMSYADITPVFQASVSDRIVPRLRLGEVDAVFTANPIMLATASTLNQAAPLRLLPIDRAVINRLRGSYPFLKPVTIAANKLKSQREPVETMGSEWVLVCRSDLSEELVYQLTREFFANLPALAHAYGEAALIDPEQAPATPIPLHAGAARYYREREVLR